MKIVLYAVGQQTCVWALPTTQPMFYPSVCHSMFLRKRLDNGGLTGSMSNHPPWSDNQGVCQWCLKEIWFDKKRKIQQVLSTWIRSVGVGSIGAKMLLAGILGNDLAVSQIFPLASGLLRCTRVDLSFGEICALSCQRNIVTGCHRNKKNSHCNMSLTQLFAKVHCASSFWLSPQHLPCCLQIHVLSLIHALCSQLASWALLSLHVVHVGFVPWPLQLHSSWASLPRHASPDDPCPGGHPCYPGPHCPSCHSCWAPWGISFSPLVSPSWEQSFLWASCWLSLLLPWLSSFWLAGLWHNLGQLRCWVPAVSYGNSLEQEQWLDPGQHCPHPPPSCQGWSQPHQGWS